MSEQPLLEARKIVKSFGRVQALIAQRPSDIGSQGVEQAFNALEGKPTTKKIGTESVSITKDNLSENQDNLSKPSC